MKMYIFINRDVVPDDKAPLIAAHASLACYLKFKDDERMKKWLETSFKKVICSVTQIEFDFLSTGETVGDFNITTESSLDNKKVAIAFCPREEYPRFFKYYKLWTGK